MDALIRKLADTGWELISEVPEMLLRFDSSASSIKGKLGHPLTLWNDGAIVYEGLESLPVFTLEHHLKVLPASAAVISFLSINVEGFQVIYSPVIEDFPVLLTKGEIKIESGGFPVGVWMRYHVIK